MRVTEIINEVELTKNQWAMLVSNGDKEELGYELVDLVKHAYNNTPDGSFVNSIKDVIPSDWRVIDWDDEPDVDATVFYRQARGNEPWSGFKIQGIGHDGAQTSKAKAVAQVREMLTKQGVWIESSDAMRAVLKKHGAEAVTDESFLQRLFNDPELVMTSADTYQRRLGTKVIEETVFGFPVLK